MNDAEVQNPKSKKVALRPRSRRRHLLERPDSLDEPEPNAKRYES